GLTNDDTSTCFGKTATYTAASKSIHVYLGTAVSTTNAGDLTIQYYGDDSSSIYTVTHAITACPIP
ncbi:MAG: hypothetical protein HQL88_11025, partial [Magnetococcales bacterium]|nr:hypothetical protein [Magnetococcales bacterium]